MKIQLTDEQIKAIVRYDDLIINDEILTHIEKTQDMDDNGQLMTHIYRRPSDMKYFKINIFYVRYGYENYDFELSMQDKTAYEVKKKKVTITQWINVEE